MGNDRTGLLPRRRPLVLGAGLHRSVDVCDAVAAGRLQEDSARARALARAGVGARHRRRRPKRCCSRRFRRRRASTRRKPRRRTWRSRAIRSSRRSRQTTVQRAVNTDKDVFKVGDLYYMCYQGVWFVGKTATGPWEVAELGAAGDLPDPGQLAVASRHLRHRRRRRRRRLGDVRGGRRLHRDDGRLGLHGVGHGLVLPAVLRLRRLLSVLLPALPDLRLLGLVQPVDRRLRAQRRASTDRTAAPASARATTRAPAPTRAAPRRTARTARAAWRRRTTRAPAPTRRRGRDRTSTAAGDRPPCSAATTGPRPIATPTGRPGTTTRTVRTDEGGAVTASRRPDGGRRRAGSGGNVYAGNDGNVYRKDGGTWQKYDNGGWNNTDKQPSGQPRTTDRSTVDRSTTDQLNRDSAARREGAQRTQDLNTYRGGTGTRGTGSYRGGGGSRGGGGGRRR